MRSDPALLRGANKYWIRFFLLSVYATMYVRDHTRPAFHAALGLDPTAYDYQVFRICSEISKQVFPLTLDTDNPKFQARMDRMRQLSEAMGRQKARGGFLSLIRRGALLAALGVTFARLYLMPAQDNALPQDVRLSPAW
jgi:magnesium-protoporphyrin IX monomethyl ester (oxidative) cyclase